MLFCLILTMVPTASAVGAQDVKYTSCADQLYQLGLFKGTGMKADNTPEYALAKAPSRAEALVMLIRLLGEEEQAKACTASHPFADVKGSWAECYVAYGYKQGYCNGTSATTFGPNVTANAKMFVTFILRALGYDDSAAAYDFAYNLACRKGAEIGLFPEGTYDYGTFRRDDCAYLCYQALFTAVKQSGKTLLEVLVEKGAVKAEAAERALPGLGADWIIVHDPNYDAYGNNTGSGNIKYEFTYNPNRTIKTSVTKNSHTSGSLNQTIEVLRDSTGTRILTQKEIWYGSGQILLTNRTFDRRGNLLSVESSNGMYDLTTGALNFMNSQSTTTYKNTYDKELRLVQVDSVKEVSGRDLQKGPYTVTGRTTYDKWGNVLEETTTTHYLEKQYQHAWPDQVQKRVCAYDARGNCISLSDYTDGHLSQTYTYEYVYQGALVTSLTETHTNYFENGNVRDSTETVTTYDKWGNPVKKVETPLAGSAYYLDRVTTWEYQYDGEGRILTGKEHRITHDTETTWLTYAPLLNEYESSITTRTFDRNSGKLLQEEVRSYEYTKEFDHPGAELQAEMRQRGYDRHVSGYGYGTIAKTVYQYDAYNTAAKETHYYADWPLGPMETKAPQFVFDYEETSGSYRVDLPKVK